MKKYFLVPGFLMCLCFLFLQVFAQKQKEWTMHSAKKWFHKFIKTERMKGLSIKPHQTVDVVEFAKQYHLNQSYWDKAFAFLKDQDLGAIAKGKYPIDGENVYASVTEDSSKNFDKTNWESHRKYIDLQCVINGEELIGVYPVSKAVVTKEYEEKRDATNYKAEGKLYSAKPGTYFLFFPGDAHRPNITPGGNKVVKKIVIKIRV